MALISVSVTMIGRVQETSSDDPRCRVKVVPGFHGLPGCSGWHRAELGDTLVYPSDRTREYRIGLSRRPGTASAGWR
jgi:hypothetical protein